jgi:hypothetical protein
MERRAGCRAVTAAFSHRHTLDVLLACCKAEQCKVHSCPKLVHSTRPKTAGKTRGFFFGKFRVTIIKAGPVNGLDRCIAAVYCSIYCIYSKGAAVTALVGWLVR